MNLDTRSNKVDDGKRRFVSSNNQEFLETFRKELELAKPAIKKDIKNGGRLDIYCLKTENEMFADCYTLLMLGKCPSKDTILEYFPETLEQAKKQIEYVRSADDNLRHQVAPPKVMPAGDMYKIQGIDEIMDEIAIKPEIKFNKTIESEFM